ncbi:MAG: DNA mismatch repair protein MutS [Cyclobacteriaceae bacterium]|nr:MAG: DNA mismatch repair protein MutS [Cyclobacteriaceae bacterium]
MATHAAETPLMKQYNAIKAKYPGALLLFRVGDFYETFGEDAVITSRVLDIVLTRRGNGSASEVELAGFPHHALDTYLPKLVRAGYRVAICDQLEDPKFAKGVVKRGVTELVTPGVSFNDNVLETRQNNFLAALFAGNSTAGIAFLDVSTGEFLAAQGTETYVLKLIQSFSPAEILYNKAQRHIWNGKLDPKTPAFALDDWVFERTFAEEKLLRQFNVSTLRGFGLEGMDDGLVAAGAILHYLETTEHHHNTHITSIARIEEDQYVWLDKFTIRNLELLKTPFEGGVPLVDILDRTVTPMGGRLMRRWVVLPLKDLAEIHRRQEVVAALTARQELLEKLTNTLQQVGDLERLGAKVAAGRINPRELSQLCKSLLHIPAVQQMLSTNNAPELNRLAGRLADCTPLTERIRKELRPDAPAQAALGNLINPGVHAELDELRQIAYSGKDYLVQIQKREAERTGIASLKISYNKVFGYYLEVSNANKNKVPPDWIRKQTLVNAERYITEELKAYEEKILHAEERLLSIEQQLFRELVQFATGFVKSILQNARILAELDCLMSFALVARAHRYVKPEVNNSLVLDIRNGRHPVIEQRLPPGETYVPNDVYADTTSRQILIITGPNMAGKSALLRQTALIVLMAQTGCFVPADTANIGLVDKIFTRVGASDNLSGGESTFMVEMIETASILNNLSERSLILMDEIGRGTSTYDGISIAWAIVEYLHEHARFKPRTLFATHYHELNQLADDLVRVKNYNVSVKEAGDKIIFLRKLKEGGSEHSFGIHVAQMAGIPNKVVLRANEVLHFLERNRNKGAAENPHNLPKPATNIQLNLFEADPTLKRIQEMLKGIDINTISPVEALLKLNEVISVLKNQ